MYLPQTFLQQKHQEKISTNGYYIELVWLQKNAKKTEACLYPYCVLWNLYGERWKSFLWKDANKRKWEPATEEGWKSIDMSGNNIAMAMACIHSQLYLSTAQLLHTSISNASTQHFYYSYTVGCHR